MRRIAACISILALGIALGGAGAFAWHAAHSGLSQSLRDTYIPSHGKSLSSKKAIALLVRGSTSDGVIGVDDADQTQIIMPVQINSETVYRISVFGKSNSRDTSIETQDHTSARSAVNAIKDQGVQHLWPYAPPGTE